MAEFNIEIVEIYDLANEAHSISDFKNKVLGKYLLLKTDKEVNEVIENTVEVNQRQAMEIERWQAFNVKIRNIIRCKEDKDIFDRLKELEKKEFDLLISQKKVFLNYNSCLDWERDYKTREAECVKLRNEVIKLKNALIEIQEHQLNEKLGHATVYQIAETALGKSAPLIEYDISKEE